MPIKRIITGGCSFSVTGYNEIINWVDCLKGFLPNVTFRHTGYMAQGQELIQKKLSLALVEELEKFQPEEILILVMWSGTERNAFYVDNKFFIEDLANKWHNKKMYLKMDQFLDLKNSIPVLEKKKIADEDNRGFFYNIKNGWYSFHPADDHDDCLFIKQYNSMFSTTLPSTIKSLENIIFLQNFCKTKNIKIYQMFYMSYVYKDFLEYKDNINLNYLYKQLDHSTIITTEGMLDYLKKEPDHLKFFKEDTVHPNALGSKKFTDEIILPFLQSKSII